MPQANQLSNTTADPFWSNFHKAEAVASEAELDALVGDAAAFSRGVWAKPAATLEDLRQRAEVAAYYTGGLDETGEFVIEGLKSPYLNERAVAEFIAAVLALDKK